VTIESNLGSLSILVSLSVAIAAANMGLVAQIPYAAFSNCRVRFGFYRYCGGRSHELILLIFCLFCLKLLGIYKLKRDLVPIALYAVWVLLFLLLAWLLLSTKIAGVSLAIALLVGA